MVGGTKITRDIRHHCGTCRQLDSEDCSGTASKNDCHERLTTHFRHLTSNIKFEIKLLKREGMKVKAVKCFKQYEVTRDTWETTECPLNKQQISL